MKERENQRKKIAEWERERERERKKINTIIIQDATVPS